MKTSRWLLPVAALAAFFIAGCGSAQVPAPGQTTAGSRAPTAVKPPAATPTPTQDVGVAAPAGSEIACQMVGPALLSALMSAPVASYEGTHKANASGCFVYSDHKQKTVLTAVDCGSADYQVSIDFDMHDAVPITSVPGGYVRTEAQSYAFVVVNNCLVEISYLDGVPTDRPVLEAALKAAYEYVSAGHRP